MMQKFERVAEFIVERLAELLQTQVLVVNSRDLVVASSLAEAHGLAFSETNEAMRVGYLRLPIQLDGNVGEVIVAKSSLHESASPRVTQALVELMINQAAAIAQLPNQHELKNKFIHDLLRGTGIDEADILRDAQILGMDLTRPRAVILIDAADYILASKSSRPFELTNAQIWQRAQCIISNIVSFFHLPSDTICAYIGDGEVAVLKASSTQDLSLWTHSREQTSQSNPSWANLIALKRAGTSLLSHLQQVTQASISIGIGRHHPGLQGLTQSYQDARAALFLGCRFQGLNQVHCLDQLGIAAFIGVSDQETKIDLAKHLLSPLDQEPELLRTLNVFFLENCCPSSTAHQLSVHRNTLSYRLEKITSLIGLDPRRFDQAMQIRLALFLRSLQDEPPILGKWPMTTQHEPETANLLPNHTLNYRSA